MAKRKKAETQSDVEGRQKLGLSRAANAVVQRWTDSGMPVERGGRHVYSSSQELKRWLGRESAGGAGPDIATEETELKARPSTCRDRCNNALERLHGGQIPSHDFAKRWPRTTRDYRSPGVPWRERASSQICTPFDSDVRLQARTARAQRTARLRILLAETRAPDFGRLKVSKETECSHNWS
jgi:hypothetical protein